jgi:hypothetical protein
MKISHELTNEDLRTCNAMVLAAASTPPLSNRPLQFALLAYTLGGLALIALVFDFSFWACLAVVWYVIGLAWLYLKGGAFFGLREKRHPDDRSMQREYLLAADRLEVAMVDLTQVVPLVHIRRVESRSRGTLLHFAHSTPLFLPFGTEYRTDFLDALRAKVPPPLDRRAV